MIAIGCDHGAIDLKNQLIALRRKVMSVMM